MSTEKRPVRWPWIAAAILGVTVFVITTFFEIRIGEPDRREVGGASDIEALASRDDVNVLFILIDTLRADRLGSYGYERDTSPNLDVVASRGVRFARTLSQSSWTKCSMASLWSAFYPVRNGITRFDHQIPEEALLPAEVFRDAGFRTAAVFRNGWVSAYFGFAQGFDVYSRPTRQPPDVETIRKNPTVKEGGTDADVTAAAMEFMRVNRNDRWFLYMHLMDVHEYLYSEETALFGSDYSDVYDNSIRWTDSILGAFFGFMAEEGFLENTLIVIGSDHGEAFNERGLEGHARHVYKESTEVPLMLSFPFRLEPGAVVDVRTRNIDIWPTVFDLVGLPPIEGADGRSLKPQILAAVSGEPQQELGVPSFAFLDQNWGQPTQVQAPTVAVDEGPYRYVLRPEPRFTKGGQLFDRSKDPSELAEMNDSEPELAAKYKGLAESFLTDSPPAPWGVETPTLEVNEIQLNQLRALGYALP